MTFHAVSGIEAPRMGSAECPRCGGEGAVRQPQLCALGAAQGGCVPGGVGWKRGAKGIAQVIILG